MYLHRTLPLALGMLATLLPPELCSRQDDGPSDWDAILEEAEAGSEWAADPLEELGLFEEKPLDLFYSTSLSVGTGYSDNYLKGSNPDGSGYLVVEADAWINWLGDRDSITGMLFAEANSYFEDEKSTEEYIAFARGIWTRQSGDFEYGTELELFYGDQVYDASLLSNGGPKGENLRQFRPGAGLFADWYFSSRDRLRAGFNIQRAEYSFPEEDWWEPVLATEWEHLWTRFLTTTTRVEFSRRMHDDKKARRSDGFEIRPGRTLLVNRLVAEESLLFNWKRLDWLDLHLNFGLVLEDDRVGEYESQTEAWVSLATKVKWSSGHVRLNARWTDIRYRQRQVGYFDKRRLEQTHASLKLELKKKLPWNLAVYLRGEWSRFDSLVKDEEYKEQRVEGLVGWSY
jgi:hypothetical protein